jgi:molecular chaperone DnaK
MQEFFGLDFGTANTVVYRLTQASPEPIPVDFPGLTKSYGDVPVLPSILSYDTPALFNLGAQANPSLHAFRWMKHYQLHRNPYTLQVQGSPITSTQAAETFLQVILEKISANKPSLGISVPVDAYEPFQNWLTAVCERYPFSSIHLIDEASAAAIGVGIQRLPDQLLCLIDFGAGTLDVSIVKFDAPINQDSSQHQQCTVLAKNGLSLGGLHLDQWLYEELLSQSGISKQDPRIQSISAALLQKCESLKIQLSGGNDGTIKFSLPEDDSARTFSMTCAEFETLLKNNQFQNRIEHCISGALATLSLKAFTREAISQVICVGGGSQLPAFVEHVRQLFPNTPVSCQHAMDAVSRGAALFASGEPFFNHIQHDYALRFYNQAQDSYQYHPLVKKGTPYPSTKPIAELQIKATYEQQQRFGIPIYELNPLDPMQSSEFELFFDPSGAVQLLPLTQMDSQERSSSWLNENNPTFLFSAVPAAKGEVRFKLSFSLDENKRLLVSSYDMIEKKWVLQDHPVVRLN